MKILVDIDSTITNFSHVLLDFLNKSSKTNYDHSDIISYDWFDNTFTLPWLPTNTKEFWDKVEVDKTAIKVIEQWAKNGHRVYLVSASYFNDMLGYKIRKTLENFNPKYINESNIIIAQHKNMIKGNILIDDCVENLEKFDECRICYAQPWNIGWEPFRRNTWKEIDNTVDKIFKITEE